MAQPFVFLAILAGGVLALLAFGVFVSKPGRSIVPLYAATLPIASSIELSIPLPPPFDTLSSLLGAIAIGACLGYLVIFRKGSIPTPPVALWVLLLAWITLGVFWADDAQGAFEKVMVAVPLVLLMALVSALPRKEIDFELLRGAVILSGLLVGLYGLGLRTAGAQLPVHGVSERFAIATNPAQTDPNIVAATLLLPLVMSLERMIMGARAWKAFGAVSTLLTIFAIFLTASRGGIIAAIIAILLTIFFCSRVPGGGRSVGRALGQATAFSLGVALLIVVAIAFGPARPIERLQARYISTPIERLSRTQADSSGRLEIWQAGVFACRTHCALGAGLDNFPEVFNQVSTFSRADKYVGANRPAHNIILSIAVETGVVGLSLFALALGSEWMTLSRPRMSSLSPGLKAAVIGMLAVNFFLSLLWYKYIWLIFTLIRAAETSSSPDPRRGLSAAAWRDRALF